jgi:hypothetical protein
LPIGFCLNVLVWAKNREFTDRALKGILFYGDKFI